MSLSVLQDRVCALILILDSGIGGGVVSQAYFKEHFGLMNADGSTNTKKSNEVSSNVVSVLQAGAFFGALGSAPISGERCLFNGLSSGQEREGCQD